MGVLAEKRCREVSFACESPRIPAAPATQLQVIASRNSQQCRNPFLRLADSARTAGVIVPLAPERRPCEC